MSLVRYDAFKHLQHAIGLKPGDLVAMLDGYTAYLDVSRGAEPVYVLGGYVASVAQWNRFRPKWLRMLSDYQTDMFVPADLDLKDKSGHRIGRYKGWSDEKMLAFKQRAHRIIKSHRHVAVSFSIPINQFRRLKFGWMREEEGLSRLYFFTAIETLKNVLRWIDRYKIKNPIQYIFETGDEGYDEVQNALHEIQKHPELRAGITCKASLVRIKLPRFNSKRRGCGLMNVINTQQPICRERQGDDSRFYEIAISELRCSLQHLFSGGGCGAAL